MFSLFHISLYICFKESNWQSSHKHTLRVEKIDITGLNSDPGHIKCSYNLLYKEKRIYTNKVELFFIVNQSQLFFPPRHLI
jgi:hypothetical protein